MFKVLFGDVKEGRLARLPYLGYIVLLMVISMLIMFGGVFFVGGVERMMGGDLQQAQDALLQNFGVVGLVLVILLMFLLMFANFNLAAKRIRDMGLPGWLTILAVVIISVVIATIFPGESVVQSGQTTMQPSLPSSILQTIIIAALLLVPGSAFANNKS